jgi:hypothetical protein
MSNNGEAAPMVADPDCWLTDHGRWSVERSAMRDNFVRDTLRPQIEAGWQLIPLERLSLTTLLR